MVHLVRPKSLLLLLVGGVLFLSSFLAACSQQESVEDMFAKTQAVVKTYVAATQTANAEEKATPTPEPSSTPEPTEIPPTPTATIQFTSTPIAHQLIPVGPGLPLVQIVDTFSGNTANEQRAPEGDLYENYQLLERPFSADMEYLPDIDIRKAELGKDDNFIYITIYLESTLQSFSGGYSVEFDTDADGRGDYLIWVDAPSSTQWQMENVLVFVDTNNDVGGANVSASDAPNGGDGFETLLHAVNQFTDPDLVFCRVEPDHPGRVQVAFKPSFLDHGVSFYWRVWADNGLQSPGNYYYPDHYSIEQAGSPLNTSDDYPLAAVYALDNTCRMPYQIQNTGFEPGLCPNAANTTQSTPEINQTTPSLPGLVKTLEP